MSAATASTNSHMTRYTTSLKHLFSPRSTTTRQSFDDAKSLVSRHEADKMQTSTPPPPPLVETALDRIYGAYPN
ncbi:hypothetical protein OQA88_12436 [Cercophora sp. LCS_1]